MSGQFSFKGWVFGTWLTKNKDKVKNIITVAGGILTGWIGVHLLGNTGVLAGAAASLVISFLLDAFDYWVSEQSTT